MYVCSPIVKQDISNVLLLSKATGAELSAEPIQGALETFTKQQSADKEAETSVASGSRPATELPPEEVLHSEKNSRAASTTLNTDSTKAMKPNTGGEDASEVGEDSELRSSTPLSAAAANAAATGDSGDPERSTSQQQDGDIPAEVIEEEEAAPLEENLEPPSSKPQSRAASRVSFPLCIIIM